MITQNQLLYEDLKAQDTLCRNNGETDMVDLLERAAYLINATENGQDDFQRFVKSELGDIAVIDGDHFVSEKIRTYWRIWCASRGVQA